MKRLASLILACAFTAQAGIGHCVEETSAKKGPLRLTLTLHSTKIRAKEPIWFKIKLTNVSKKDIAIQIASLIRHRFSGAMKYNSGFHTFLSIWTHRATFGMGEPLSIMAATELHVKARSAKLENPFQRKRPQDQGGGRKKRAPSPKSGA